MATEQNASAPNENYQKVEIVGGQGSAFANGWNVSAAGAGLVAANGVFPVSDNAGSLTVDAPVGTPVFVRLSDGAAAVSPALEGGNLASLLARFPATAALADATSNPTLSQIQSFLMGYNGTTWDRLKATSGSLNVHLDSQTVTVSGTVNQGTPTNWAMNVAQINGVTPLMGNGVTGTGSLRVTIASDNTANSNPFLVTNVPKSNSGWSFSYKSALTNSVSQIKGSAGTFGGYINLFNPNTATTYIQVFNLPSASVTLGTTAPDFVITLPGLASASGTGSDRNLELVNGLAMSAGITVAATTTQTGSTAPSNAVVATFLYV